MQIIIVWEVSHLGSVLSGFSHTAADIIPYPCLRDPEGLYLLALTPVSSPLCLAKLISASGPLHCLGRPSVHPPVPPPPCPPASPPPLTWLPFWTPLSS